MAPRTLRVQREPAAHILISSTIIRGKPLPKGWTGKLWAVEQGVEQALPLHPDFLLFTDADILHSPESIATLIDIAESGGYDLDVDHGEAALSHVA